MSVCAQTHAHRPKIWAHFSEIAKTELIGEKVGQYDLQNKIRVTLKNANNLDIKLLKRNFLTNSSCGVCGKTSIDSIEVICKKN